MIEAVPSRTPMPFSEAVSRFEASGFMLARLETLVMAMRDKRLDRTAGIVLSHLVEALNFQTGTTYIGRDAIANRMGISVKSVSNYLSQLRALGYIASEHRITPQANNRSLLHYTLTALSPEELEKSIAHALASMRGEINTVVPMRVSSRPDGNSVPVGTGTQSETSCQDGNSLPAGTGTGEESSRQDGRSNTSLTTVENLTTVDASLSARPARGSRLPDDWLLPKPWGEWALEHFEVSAKDVRDEAGRFRNYWVAKAGKDATKRDWYATWQNWCGSDIRAWKRRKVDATHAPDLIDARPAKLKISRW